MSIALAMIWPLYALPQDEQDDAAISVEEDFKELLKKHVTILSVPQMDGDIKLDGLLNEPFWTRAAHVPVKIETYPNLLADSPVRTHARVGLLNENIIVVGFEAFDPNPRDIRAPLRDRDGIELDDYVGLSIDPSGKGSTTYELYVSAAGIQADWLRNKVADKRSRDWDADWESAAHVTNTGYSVEMKIPVSELAIPEDIGDRKRILVLKRHYPRDVRHHLSAFTMLVPQKDIIDDQSLTIQPSISYENEWTRDAADKDPWESEDEASLSLDFAYKITPSFDLLATMNPNYLQVEADLTETSLNDPFSRLVPEKRPFFLSGLDAYGTFLNLVYTRNIENPRGGVQGNGTIGDLNTGNFVIDDRELRLIVPGNLGSKTETLDLRSQSGAFRYRYDPKENFSIGAITTARIGESNYRNVLAGPDIFWKAGRHHELRGQFVYSETDYPADLQEELYDDDFDPEFDEGRPGETGFNEQVLRSNPDQTYSDAAWGARYRFRTRRGYVNAQYRDVGEDFRGDLGYMPRVDYRVSSLSAGMDHYMPKEDQTTSRIRFSVNRSYTESQVGDELNDSTEFWAHYWGGMQSWLRVGYRNRDRIAKRFDQDTLDIEGNAPVFNEEQYMFRIESTLVRNGRLTFAARFGDQIDTDNYRVGDLIEFEPGLRWSPTPNTEIALHDVYRRLKADGEEVFEENYITLNLTYQMNRSSFLRLTMIDNIEYRNQDNYLYEEVDAVDRKFSSELLYAWKPSKLNTFFVGVKVDAEKNDEVDRITADETLFYIKYSRSLRPGQDD